MFKTARELLDRVKEFHRDLSSYYANVSEIAHKERVKTLLRYMSRHETSLVQCLDRYEKEAAKKVMDTWFQFPPALDKRKCFEGVRKLESDMSLEDVVETALWFDNCLVEFYQQLADTSVSEDVTELFQNLLERVKEEKHEAARTLTE
jgi:triphosphoribosyl-dephospho-CoA synthetase